MKPFPSLLSFFSFQSFPLAATLLLLLAGCAGMDDNFRAVHKEGLYRSAQMRGDRLGEAIRDHGITTVVNLRGTPNDRWLNEERAVCDAYGVTHVDLDWSKDELPDPESLAAYVDLLRNANGPVLVHCQAGIHRTGVASAIYILLHGGTPDQARDQFGFYFYDAPIGQLVTLYENRGTLEPFYEWVHSTYPREYAEWKAGQKGPPN